MNKNELSARRIWLVQWNEREIKITTATHRRQYKQNNSITLNRFFFRRVTEFRQKPQNSPYKAYARQTTDRANEMATVYGGEWKGAFNRFIFLGPHSVFGLQRCNGTLSECLRCGHVRQVNAVYQKV